MQGKNNRDKMIVTTKFGLTKHFQLEYKSIVKSAEQSLKRLKTDYIDIYMTHFEIPPNKIEQVVLAFIELYKQGKIKSIGVSHSSLGSIKVLVDSINSLTNLKVSAVQDSFNPIERTAQHDLIPYLNENNIAFIGARGLAGGFLNGSYKNLKYNQLYKIRGILRHARTAGPKVIYPTYRATLPAGAAFKYLSGNYTSLYSYLILLAKKYQCTMPTIVFSFLMQFDFLTSSIIGINRQKDFLSFYTVPLNDSEIKLIESKANQ
jgi:aryl-alcohol dehydrogenase-like predicted oxidoreductase